MTCFVHKLPATEAPWASGIDLLAEKGEVLQIIETKLSNDSHSMAHALGQLLFYSKFIPGASLWVCTPEKPDSTILSILSSFNVNFLEINDDE